MSNSDYTKVSDELVAKYGIKTAYVYAKLRYRMQLSHGNPKHFFNDGFFEIYKIKDLMKDCHLGKNSIINILKKLENAHFIHRIHTMFANRIYLPKFENPNSGSEKQTQESLKSKPSKEQRPQNKNYNNNYVYVHRSSVRKQKKYPSTNKIIQKYGLELFKYAINRFHFENDTHLATIHNPYHFIIGILRRWARKGIKTVNDAMQSENDGRAQYLSGNYPKIPIFKI